jgi:glycosyltransferase involved in cell wall biosynthesis
MISIVIRNKNEATSLENTLFILTKMYKSEFEEIIIVDNNSTDNSLEIAKEYNCKIVTIVDFTYGKATNLGIKTSTQDYVLLLSSHAVPIGSNFFKSSINKFKENKNIAGIRYINSIENYKRAIKNNFKIIDPLKFGLMTGCAMINKNVWEKHKFDERLVFSEDKHWSDLVVKKGYEIVDLNETFFYEVIRNTKLQLKRYKNETIAYYQLNDTNYQGNLRIIGSFLKKLFISNQIDYLRLLRNDFNLLKVKFQIKTYLETKKN